jgi:hypothetical protein
LVKAFAAVVHVPGLARSEPFVTAALLCGGRLSRIRSNHHVILERNELVIELFVIKLRS